jgi:hypothetical protein
VITSGFTDAQRRDLRRRLNPQKVATLLVRDPAGGFADAAPDAIVYRLEAIVIAAKKGEFRSDAELPPRRAELMKVASACHELQRVYLTLDEDTRATLDRMIGTTFRTTLADGAKAFEQLKARPRGRPPDLERFRIALAVGWVLLREGVRSQRAPRSGSLGGRDGPFAHALGAVLDASGLSVPEDLYDLVTKVTPIVEREAFGSG